MPSPTAVEGRAACGPLAGTFALVALAFFAAHMTSPTKPFGRLAPRLP